MDMVVVQDMLPELSCIISIFWLSLWLFFFYRRRKSTDWMCFMAVWGLGRSVWSGYPKTMCFTLFSGLRREVSGLSLLQNHVFYSVC